MAQIIKLSTARVSSIRGKDGQTFPQLYRGIGYEWDSPDQGIIVKNISPSDRLSTPFYTLSTEDSGGRARVHWTPIDRLSPDLDTGWVIVRKHRNKDCLDGYLDGMNDCVSYETDKCSQTVFETSHGLFTVHHRPATPTCKDLLLAYSYSVYDADNEIWFPEYAIVDSEGKELAGEALLPEDAGMQSLIDHIEKSR